LQADKQTDVKKHEPPSIGKGDKTMYTARHCWRNYRWPITTEFPLKWHYQNPVLSNDFFSTYFM